jgi:hypothetical protein
MNELVQKISSYHILNYLLPGGILLMVLPLFGIPFDFQKESISVVIILSYFSGLVISRVWSIILQPFLEKTGFIKRTSSYDDYLEAKKNDSSIESLLETSNLYRTLSALFLITGILSGYFYLTHCFTFIPKVFFIENPYKLACFQYSLSYYSFFLIKNSQTLLVRE